MLSIANVRRAASDCSLSEHLQPDEVCFLFIDFFLMVMLSLRCKACSHGLTSAVS